MRKVISILLCAVMMLMIAPQSVSYDLEATDFAGMTVQDQYAFMQTLESEEDIQQALDSLTDEQHTALEAYAQSLDTDKGEKPDGSADDGGSVGTAEGRDQGIPGITDPDDLDGDPSDESEDIPEDGNGKEEKSEEPSGDSKPDDTNGVPMEEGEEPADEPGEGKPSSFSQITPEEQYLYLLTLESEDEIMAALALLNDEQYAVLEAYVLSLNNGEPEQRSDPAVDYTKAGPFLEPVDISAPVIEKSMMSAMGAMPGLSGASSTEEADGIVVSKQASNGTDSDHLLTIEAYATGEVSVTSTEEAIPTDIILVLDTSGSMRDPMMTDALTGIDFPINRDAYNYKNDLFVMENGEPRSVEIECRWIHVCLFFGYYEYTYSYTAANGNLITYTSNTSLGNPPDWDFYTYAATTRMAALKTAANSFINSIAQKANEEDGVDHRIAVVRFSSGSSIVSGSSASNAFVAAQNNSSGINTLKSAINGLSANGATRADLGMQNAVNIFVNDPPDTTGPRNRVVVFFTDGCPTRSGSFDYGVANSAISKAKSLKNTCGATVYTIGIFDGANPAAAIGSTSRENKFMHFVSSNYSKATSMGSGGAGGNNGYYLSASSAGTLKDIFQTISRNIETGGTLVTLDDTAVLKDILTSHFVDAGNIRLYTAALQSITGSGERQWAQKVPFTQGSVSIDGRTISISGFDYSNNYCAAIETNGRVTGYRGKKLIVEIPIDYLQGSCFGGTVPTNEAASGIFQQGEMVKNLPVPYVDIPVNYDYTARDKSIYLTQSASIPDLFTNEPGFIPNGVNNAFVDIVYAVKDPGSVPLATYTIPAGQSNGSWNTSDLDISGLAANTVYIVSCTVTPVSGPVPSATIDKTATVYVWKPEITYKDSTIYLGESANYDDNFVNIEWKNSSNSALSPTRPKPVLTYEYAPLAVLFEADTHVTVKVKIGGQNITGHTTFIHNDCNPANCGFDPNCGQFVVHVKTCSLTIVKEGAADTTDTFIFTVEGSGMVLNISVQGNNAKTIVGLPVGNYTITEEKDWSWRYTAARKSATLSSTKDSAQVTISNALTNDQWLSGGGWCANLFALIEN